MLGGSRMGTPSTTSEYLHNPIELDHSRNHAEGLHLVELKESADCGAGATPASDIRHQHN